MSCIELKKINLNNLENLEIIDLARDMLSYNGSSKET